MGAILFPQEPGISRATDEEEFARVYKADRSAELAEVTVRASNNAPISFTGNPNCFNTVDLIAIFLLHESH